MALGQMLSSSESVVMSKPSVSKFRLGGLDGLRALAAIAVLLYHTYPSLLPGGFIGVDVFFVLSGFLITGLLECEWQKNGKLQLKAFWLRRFRRLFPAVFSTVLVCLPLAYLIDPDLLTRIKSQVIGSLTFSYNWVQIWQQNNYFDSNCLMLLSNMWTLAVEQQFYLIWPLVLLLLWKIPCRLFHLGILLLLGGGSVFWMHYLVVYSGLISHAYMDTFSHGFGLIFGAFLALLLQNVTIPSRRELHPMVRYFWGAICIFAFLGLIFSFFLITDKTKLTYPWLILLTVLLAMLVVQGFVAPMQNGFGPARWLREGLDHPILVWLGERSYGIYLWHWPLFVIYEDCFRYSAPLIKTLVILGVSIVLAALSYRWVETPMRFHGIFSSIKKAVQPIYNKPLPGDGIRILVAWLTSIVVIVLFSISGLALYQSTESSYLEKELQKQVELQRQSVAQKKAKKPDISHKPTKKDRIEKKWSYQIIGENIILIGDSVTVGAVAQAQEKWPGMIVDGQVSRSSRVLSKLLEQYKAQGRLRPYVVVGVGTNGNIFESEIEDWLKIIGPDRKLILINAFGPERISWIPESNQAITAAAKKHSKKIYIADWYSQAKGHRDDLYRDQIHPQPSGVQYYIRAIEEALVNAYRGNSYGTGNKG